MGRHALRLWLVYIFGFLLVACTSTSPNVDAIDALVVDPSLIHPVGASTWRIISYDDNPRCELESDANFRAMILARINALRERGASCGDTIYPPAPPLAWNETLFNAAYLHSLEMAQSNLVSHQSLDGKYVGARLQSLAYPFLAAAENIAAGQKDALQVLTAWEKSPSHCANMMRSDVDEIGVSCIRRTRSFYRYYWTMNLAKQYKQVKEKEITGNKNKLELLKEIGK